MNIYWADLHNHNEIGYGKGTLSRSYEIAKSLLDVYAFVPHAWYPDAPKADKRFADYQLNAFDKVQERYPEVIETANAHNRDGEFVTFIGYEWHSNAWGDYHVIFPSGSGEICRAETVEELQNFAREKQAILIPHHCAYRVGWRGTNWHTWSADVSPVTEMFSEHGDSMTTHNNKPMCDHSMGGSCHTQTVLHQLCCGKQMGLVAGTDNHYGHPANYGEGLTAICADALTRDDIHAALKSRHTYGVTGDRIELQFNHQDAMMGDTLKGAATTPFNYHAKCWSPLENLQLIKNGNVVHNVHSQALSEPANTGRYVLRLQWGWDQLEKNDMSTWMINLKINGGRILSAQPCFSGGAASVELVNGIDWNEHGVDITSFTSRLNAEPQSGCVLEIEGDLETSIHVSCETQTEGQAGGFLTKTDLKTLCRDELWKKILPRFSSPRFHIGCPINAHDLEINGEYKDEDPQQGDFYLLRVLQKNGHYAWSSPIFS